MCPLPRFEVWAPAASKVELVVGERRHEMSAHEGGWFRLETGYLGPVVDYSFSVDGGDALPDPRSRFQPGGPHGPSRWVDHDAYEWGDSSWNAPPLASAIFYELHLGAFSAEGTFRGAIEHLDHLVDLGVTAVELMPVAGFSGDHGWGYDGVDLFAPHHAYGEPDDLKALVDACHQRGLAIVLDVVYNHLGPSGNYLDRFGPYFTDRYATPWGKAINFDGADSDEVRAFLLDNVSAWLRDYHFDGLRLDAIHAILDTSATHILEDIAVRVRSLETELGRTLWVIAESDLNDPRIVTPVAAGGYGIDAQWSDDFHHSLFAALTRDRAGYYADFGSIDDISTALESAFVYGGRYSRFRRRRHGRPVRTLEGHRFLGYLQNHDQVGNRATGDRSSALLSDGLLKVGAALVFTSPFVPMLFMGEEWAASTPFPYFTNHPDERLGRAVSEGRKREFEAFGWDPKDVPDPQDPETFARAKLDWSEVSRDRHAELLDWHKQLIALRKAMPDLREGRLERVRTYGSEEGRWIVVERGTVTVVCNLSSEERKVSVAEERTTELLLASGEKARREDGSLMVPAAGVSIYGVMR